MIQLNLLPDVKLKYIKAQRQRRLVTTIALVTSAVSLGLLILLLGISGLQRKHLADLSRDIAKESKQLQGKPEINKILTVQNQLQSLTALHSQKPAAYRLFGYLNQVTPEKVSISSLQVDYTTQTMTITGSADALSSVNKYVDTLKFTTFTGDNVSSATKAFSNVVLQTFSLTSGAQDGKPATYTITLAYDKAIFDNTQQVKLTVPSLTTTRVQLERPSDLFEAAPPRTGGTQ